MVFQNNKKFEKNKKNSSHRPFLFSSHFLRVRPRRTQHGRAFKGANREAKAAGERKGGMKGK